MKGMAVQTRNMSIRFGDVQAVDRVSFEVPEGIVFGFLGPNGSGKTTTIRLLLGLLAPDEGQASVLGFDTKTQADQIRQSSGALLEHTGLYERLSAEDNLEYFGRIWHIPAEERKTRIKDLLGDLGLYERRKENVGNWSKGMKQKLAIARVLIHNPRLIFLDEPTAGLDPVAAVSLREDLQNLVEQHGVTVFLTTHNLAEAEKLCSQVAVIQHGKLLATGSLSELGSNGDRQRLEIVGRGINESVLDKLRQMPDVLGMTRTDTQLHLELRNGVDTAPIVQMLIISGVEIEEVRKAKASLEDVFLKLVEEENVG